MGCYALAIGGTGNKILEGMVYLAAIDGFYTVQNGISRPIPEIRMLSVDVDSACGNTTRAKRASEYYEELRSAYGTFPHPHCGFHTALTVRRWNMNLSKRAMSVDKMVENHRQDQVLSNALYSKTESALEYSEGFRGHPDLGVLFFADLLNGLDSLRQMGQPDEMNELLDQIALELSQGETVKVFLCGSIFGGTGASGIPAIAKFLRQRFPDSGFELGAMLMLPYYQVPPAQRDEEAEIVVKSSAFLDKARTALQYYGMEGMIRDHEKDENGVFDALYLLGLPPESFVTTSIYSTGSQSQENDAHMMEWLACRCAAAFFRTGFRGAEEHNIDCYYYQWHTRQFCWESFDSEARRYRLGYGNLLKASALFFAECYPTLLRCTTSGSKAARRVGYCAPYFSRLSRQGGGEQAKMERLLRSLYHFLAFYCNWMIQVLRTLPPDMCQNKAEEAALPDNALLDASLMNQLYLLLKQYGLKPEERDLSVYRRACAALQKELDKLVISRVPDRYPTGKVIAGLGGGICYGQGAENALCSFFSVLLSAVGEEEML
ncbi:MAG: tubulin-like doman-containing protein [Eubacteriales bacterium]|nr:tubulin-like doman-containing protein [Eubacteriales bacterium]